MASEELKAATKARVAAKGWVTRAAKKLDKLCDAKDVDLVDLNDAVDEFDKRIGHLDEAQTDVELELDEDLLEADIDAEALFRDLSRKSRLRAAKIISGNAKLSDHGSQSSRASVEVKLPKLELPSFSGDVLEWQSFWEQYTAIIHTSDLPTINKFTYLQSLIHGEAKSAIQGLSITEANYQAACDILNERFGRSDRIIFQHIQDLLNISPPEENSSVATLWKLCDDLRAHVRSLESLEVKGDQYGVILTPLILSRLPQDIRLEWARDGKDHEKDLDYLLTFLVNEIQRRERSQSFKDVLQPPQSEHADRDQPLLGTAAALQTSSKGGCGVCHKNHPTNSCKEFVSLTFQERRNKIFESGLCFKCLGQGHIARTCQAKCSKCQGRHHVIICQAGLQTADGQANVAHVGVSSAAQQNQVVLQTIQVCIRGKGGFASATVLFDTGADKTYIAKGLVDRIKPQWVGAKPLAYAAFGSGKPSTCEMRSIVEVNLKGSQGSTHTLQATEVPVICAAVYRPTIPQEMMQSFRDLPLVENSRGSVDIDMLVGLDYYWQLVEPRVVQGPPGLVAQKTAFGWMVSGALPGTENPAEHVSHQLLCLNDIREESLHRFWDLESVGILAEQENLVPDPICVEFQEKLRFSDGRYEVGLPWKKRTRKLLNNERLAQKRLDCLMAKLERDPVLLARYHDVFKGLEESGIVEEVPLGEIASPFPTYYMPHRPVVKEDSLTTKIRPVFDASAPGYNGVSLNDCMEVGPCMIPSLPEILIRFRRWKVALTSDITKAFLQIKVRREDQDVHRFLLSSAGNTRVMRFTRVPFGNRSSPFLLNATIQSHLAKFPSSRVIKELRENFYVDDWLSGADDDTEACRMLEEASQCMKQAGMCLSKWGSNSDAVVDKLYWDWEGMHHESQDIKVLGLRWNVETDCPSFTGVALPDGLVVTKRVILSFLARVFDPLGFLTPFVMVAKCLFQDLWKRNCDWDEETPTEIQSAFTAWVRGFQELSLWQISRRYSSLGWQECCQVEIHGFGDASERGYGACVYVRVQDGAGGWHSAPVIAKARVAPIKIITLPRLELLGALLCARLAVSVRRSLKLDTDVKISCWTDSTVALTWVRSEPGRWKTFVGNRVMQIQELVAPSCWRHCAGEQNPADLVTRGISASELIHSSLWLEGPKSLFEGGGRDGHLESIPLEVCDELESRVSLVVVKPEDPVFEVTRWSSYLRALRVIGWTQRFVHNARTPPSERRGGYLTSVELDEANTLLFCSAQEQEFNEELAN